MRSGRWLLSGWALLATAAACRGEEAVDGTLGEQGRVEFHYQRSCFFGCPLEQPLLEGTRERIAVSARGDGERVRAESSDPDVVAFAIERECFCEREDGEGGRIAIALDASCTGDSDPEKRCDNTVLVEARATGSAALELHDERELIDRVTVTVARPERARLLVTEPGELGASERNELELAAGESASIELTLYDEAGRELLAPEGVTWRVADPDVAVVSAFLVATAAELRTGLEVEVKAQREGATIVVAEVPDLQVELDVAVRPVE